jgi:predicted nucleic acid-binding protein
VVERSPGAATPPVIDSSPLILLAKANLLGLLQMFYPEVLVPSTVAAEIRQYGTTDVTFQSLIQTEWLVIVETPSIPEPVRVCNLDPGESAVLAWAYNYPDTEAILDDLAARRCANSLGIPVRGTLGLVLKAKQQGKIPSARTLLEQLRQSGMYLSERVLNQSLELVGE